MVVKNESGGNKVSTLVLRGATDSSLDDLERAVDDGINSYKVSRDWDPPEAGLGARCRRCVGHSGRLTGPEAQ